MRPFASTLLGSTVEVLFEEQGEGLTDSYVRVQSAGGETNTFAQVLITGLAPDGAGR